MGHIAIDDVYLQSGDSSLELLGGSAIYAAVGGLVWLSEVGVIVRVGYDFPSKFIKQLESYGIQLFLHPVEFPSLKGWMRYDINGRRTNAPNPDSGKMDDLSICSEDIRPDNLAFSVFHIASMPTQKQIPLVKFLKNKNKLITLDPHPDIVDNFSDLMKIFPSLIAFLPSLEQVELAFGIDDVFCAAVRFADAGCRIIVIKIGDKGSIIYDSYKKCFFHIPIFKTNTIDPTGAGDAYCGGFLASYQIYHDPILASCCGSVSASFVVEHFGALAPLKHGFSEAENRLNDIRSRVTEIKEHQFW